ncbi:dsDNA nuclease domain-containing protein [Lysinibacillus sp. JNUCC-52]|uniref:dsDNA nuclease domain-containing protein n=1 Tax=Lysinibacillus sp. JNUCC-52 TaxID=2792480 RepID=UPI001938D28E|nr:DUF4297 domain-containing protein [Lysinibacillus sp. JNUCC-52]
MIEEPIIESILEISDEKGGDSALDGFEFQVSSAIYLVFTEILSNAECALIYEKVEDFIIINDQINLYQAKSLNKNLTPNVLYSPSRKTNSDDSGLSIIEKMHINYLKVKEKVQNNRVVSNLIICENQVFSKLLSKEVENIAELKKINFTDLSSEAKSDIISATTFEEYEWENIYAHRIIPKSRHEEVTRIFIEDVISQVFGQNKINSAALYTSLAFEIKKIRKNKTILTSAFLLEKIPSFSELDNQLNFNDYVYLLNDIDKRNIKVPISFMQIQNNLLIRNHPIQNDYTQIKNLVTQNDCENVDDIVMKIETEDEFTLIKFRLKRHELLALILIVIAREVIQCN